MNSKSFFVILLYLLFIQITYAQDGYSIKIDIKNSAVTKMFLSVYDGTYNKTSAVDSISILPTKTQIRFLQTKKIIGGIYQLKFVTGSDKTDKTNKINIALDNGISLTFSLNGNTVNALETSQTLNADFLHLQRMTSSEDDKQAQLRAIVKNYSSSVLSLWASLELRKARTDSLTQTKPNFAYQNRYFQNIDLQDKRIPLLPNIYSVLYDYVSSVSINDSNYRSGIDNLLKGMDCNSRNFTFYLEWVFKNLIYLQQYKLEKTYNYVYNRYLNNPDCKKKDSLFYLKITTELNQVVNVPIGSTIPSFKMSDSLNHTFNIDDLRQKADFTFIAFYDAECPHCKETIPKVVNFFNTHQFSNTIQKIAFINPFTENREWVDFIHHAKLEDWQNVKPDNGDAKYMTDLHLTGNPSFFLIDKTGKIILKTFDAQLLESSLRHYTK